MNILLIASMINCTSYNILIHLESTKISIYIKHLVSSYMRDNFILHKL